MGLLDTLFGGAPADPNQMLGQFTDPRLQIAAGLLSGHGNLGANLSTGLLGAATQAQAQRNFAMTQQATERANRTNDLQQISGVYNILKNQDMMQAVVDMKAGRPHVPSPALSQVEQKMYSLAGMPTMAGGSPQPSPGGMPQPGPAQPAMPASPVGQNFRGANPNYQPLPQPQGAQPQQPPQPSQPSPAPQGQPNSFQDQRDMADMIAFGTGHPELVAGNLYKTATPQVSRGVSFDPRTGMPMAGFVDNVPVRFGADGSPQVIPNQIGQAIAQRAGQVAAATASATLPFQRPNVIQTEGAPTLMTVPQQITAATGQPPPNPFAQVSPGMQTQRNAMQIKILQDELGKTANPQDRALIIAQLNGLQGAQTRGQPFTSMTPPSVGLKLQDQTDAAAQAALGKGMGDQGVEIFKNGAASIQGQKLLGLMSNMAKSYTPGVFQPLKAQFGAYAMGMGIPENTVNSILGTNVGDIQGLTSAGIQMAGKLTRQTDAQPSQLQFLKTLQSMPMADRTEQGFQKIMQYLNDSHQYNIDEMVAFQKWLDNPASQGSPKGFAAAWAKQANEKSYIWNQPHGVQSQPVNIDALVNKYKSH